MKFMPEIRPWIPRLLEYPIIDPDKIQKSYRNGKIETKTIKRLTDFRRKIVLIVLTVFLLYLLITSFL